MNKIWIVGLGPGHEDYILPIAKRKIKEADIVIGGKRHLESVDTTAKKVQLSVPLYDTVDYINEHYKENQIALVVSGDTGFYSMLDYMKTKYANDLLETYPGISSLQYLFSKLNMSYKNAFIGSVHGRKLELKDIVKTFSVLGLLTDKEMTPSKICSELSELGLSGIIHIGENLSYKEEVISHFSFKEMKDKSFSKLCVAVIEIE